MDEAGASMAAQQVATLLVDTAIAPVTNELMQKHNKMKRELAAAERKTQQTQLLLAKSLQDKVGTRTVGTSYAINYIYILPPCRLPSAVCKEFVHRNESSIPDAVIGQPFNTRRTEREHLQWSVAGANSNEIS